MRGIVLLCLFVISFVMAQCKSHYFRNQDVIDALKLVNEILSHEIEALDIMDNNLASIQSQPIDYKGGRPKPTFV